MKRLGWALGGTLIVATALRVAGIRYGLPHVYHQDEPIIVNHALGMGASGLNTHFFVIPPLCISALFILYAILFVIGRFTGVWADADAFAASFLNDPTLFYVAGRVLLGVLPGVAAVYLVFRMGKKYLSLSIGLMAALLLAVAPIHVQHSHYIYADVAVAFWVTLCLDRLLALLKKPSTRRYVVLGAVFGWAVATKYTAVYFLPAVILTHGLVWGRRAVSPPALQRVVASAASGIAAFALVAPSFILHWNEALDQILHQKSAEEAVGWTHHGVYSLLEGTGWVFMALAVIGIASLAWTARSRRQAAVIAVFIGAYYAVNAVFSQYYARYMMPLIPVLAICAAQGWWIARGWISAKAVTGMIIAVALVGELGATSVYGDLLFLQQDTRTLALAWIKKNIPENTAIAVDNRFFAPPIKRTAYQITLLGHEAGSGPKQDLRKMRAALEAGSRAAGGRYRVYTLWPKNSSDRPDRMSLKPFLPASLEAIRKEGVEYLIFNMTDSSAELREFTKLWGEDLRVASFSPYRSGVMRPPLDPQATTAAPHLRRELFARARLGPCIQIYQVAGQTAE